MSTLSFVLAYLATGTAIAVFAPIVGLWRVEARFCDDPELNFICTVMATFFFVGSIVVTALAWPALIALSIYHQKEDSDK